MSKILLISCSLFALMMMSCEEAVVLDVNFESQLVINAFFDSDSPWAVEVTKSNNSLDDRTSITYVKDARVIIYDQDNVELYELYHQGKGIYGREDYSPSPARGYSVQVTSGSKVATAYSYVPQKSKLSINTFREIGGKGQKGIEVDFQIEDQSSREAYYIWEVVPFDQKDIMQVERSELSDFFISSLNSSEKGVFDGRSNIVDQKVFGDGKFISTFNSLKDKSNTRGIIRWSNDRDIASGIISSVTGLNKKIYDSVDGLEVSQNDHFDPSEDEEENDDGLNIDGELNYKTFELRVMVISKELYDYYTSVERTQSNPNTTLNNQYPIKTNVEGGIGIFAGFSESIIRF